MDKENIIKTLKCNDSTILSFPERGPWGDSKYRGNCSGYIQAFLMWKYHVEKFAELFSGSGTGYDVAKDMGVKYVGADLNPTPSRPGILQVDAFNDAVPDEFYTADMIFMHPPYGKEIKIPYAGSMYPDPTGQLSKSDLGQMEWKTFIKALNSVIMKYYSAMESGSYMSILMGDVRRGGFHSMLTDIVKPGQLEQVIIKAQHNCVSNGRSYSNRNFVPIVHEYLMVLKKIAPYIINFQLPTEYKGDIRDANSSTWTDVVAAVLKNEGRMSLSDLYRCIEGHKKTVTNNHWKEKIRQTLYIHPNLFQSQDGYWNLCA